MPDPKERTSARTAEPALESSSAGAAAAPKHEETEEWVFTFNNATGEVTKVEKLGASGQRQELSQEEYAALLGYGADYYDPTADPSYGYYEAGYYDGCADYEAAISGAGYDSGYTPEEEAAYYQGIADYAALLG
jgi:hypothetical protein